jgi:hypothetical protein
MRVAAQQLHKGLDDRVGRNLDLGVDDAGLGPEDGDAGGHQAAGGGGAQRRVQRDQLGDGVGAQHLGCIGGLNGDHALAGERSRPAISVRITSRLALSAVSWPRCASSGAVWKA